MQSGSKKVLRNLFNQKIHGTFCDVQLHHQGSILWGHSCILASCSSFFMDYLNNEANDNKHWCARKPLVITLDKIVDDDTELCFICVSKMIDFMYLRELIVIKEHFLHFFKIATFFKVLDLLPFCKQYFEKKHLTNSLNINAVSENVIKQATNNIELKKVTCDISNKNSNVIVNTSHINKLNDNTISSNLGDVKEQNKKEEKVTIDDLELTNLYTIESQSLVSIQFQKETLSTNQNLLENKELRSSIKNCEFMCCNPDLSPECEARQRKKRIIFCESCQYSSVSIKKMLKHINTTNHVKTFCPVCNLSVETIKDLNQHFEDHYNSKPFICHICQKRNRFWDYHKLHLRVHCRNKQFSCDICHKRFKYKQNLTIHLLAHSYKQVCNECGYLATDKRTYHIHQLQHNNGQGNISLDLKQEIEKVNTVANTHKDLKQNKFETLKKFQCYVCNQKFTQQKNLARHVEVKHNSNKEFKCSVCSYLTKRYDSMRHHMKKHHDCLPAEQAKTRKRKERIKVKQKQECPHKDGIVGVLIPVQLLSVDGTSRQNGFAVKAQSNEISKKEQNIQFMNVNNEETENSSTNTSFQSQNAPSVINAFHIPEKGTFQDFISESKIPTHNKVSESVDTCLCSKELQNVPVDVDKDNDWNCKAREIGSSFIERNENFWLNEATGELLNSTFMNVSNIDTGYSTDQNHCINLQTEHSSLLSSDFEVPYQSLILNEGASDPSFDLDDDRQSNPPIESQDNLFTWEDFGDNFCSTWVLNETTGELNMVNFNMQPLKLDEHTGSFSLMDDDETALFLNEGTGDLSVIYFNPSKNDCDSTNYSLNDQTNQDKLETMSQHSNDEDDVLNEEFLLASADFMARDENETFLNELTGEFDVTRYNSFHSETHHVINKSVYLNEETGEISWNVVDKKNNNEMLPNTDSLSFDFDDSLNCEDFEQFSTEINDLSSQYCIDNHNFDETCDTLLNECTGELIKRC